MEAREECPVSDYAVLQNTRQNSMLPDTGLTAPAIPLRPPVAVLDDRKL